MDKTVCLFVRKIDYGWLNVEYPKLALIDLDGTLADSLDILRVVFSEIAMEYKFKFSEDDFHRFNGPSIAQIACIIVDKYGLKIDVDSVIDKYQEVLFKTYLNAPITNGAESFIKILKCHGSKIGIVTSNNRQLTCAWLENRNLMEYVDIIITSDDVICTKPDPEPYKRALKKANVNSIEAIAIEDSESGVQSAVSAGIRTFFLNTNHTGVLNSGIIKVLTFEEILLNL